MKITIQKRFNKFSQEICQREMYPYQLPFVFRLLTSVLKNLGQELTVLFARQCGKTEALCVAVAFLCIIINLLMPVVPAFQERFQDGIWIGIFAPKGEQAEVDLRRIRKFLNNAFLNKLKLIVAADSNSKFEVYRETKDGQRTWFNIQAISASETSNIESKTLHLIIIEEAQDVTEHKILDEILPMGSATNATVILIGTVGNNRWYFYNSIKRNETLHPENNFDVDYRIPIKYNFANGDYKQYVEKQKREHGYDSEFFKKKFRNIWTLELGQLFTFDVFWKCAKKEVGWLSSCFQLPEHIFLAAGLDVAKDPDETVLGIGTVDYLHGVHIDSDDIGYQPLKILRYMETWQGVDFNAQKAQIKKTLERFPLLKQAGCIAVDATGDRGAFTEWLSELGYYVLPVVFSAGVQTGKGELCVKFVDALNAGHAFFSASEDIIGTRNFYGAKDFKGDNYLEPRPEFVKFYKQCMDCEREWKGQRLDLHHPAGMGYLDDFVDAWMLFIKAASEVNFIDFSQIKSIGQPLQTAPLMRSIERINYNIM